MEDLIDFDTRPTPVVTEFNGGIPLIILSRRYRLCSVRRYTAYNNATYDRGAPEDPEQAHAKAEAAGHPVVWLSREASVMAGRAHYEAEKALWACATEITPSVPFKFEGKHWVIMTQGREVILEPHV